MLHTILSPALLESLSSKNGTRTPLVEAVNLGKPEFWHQIPAKAIKVDDKGTLTITDESGNAVNAFNMVQESLKSLEKAFGKDVRNELLKTPLGKKFAEADAIRAKETEKSKSAEGTKGDTPLPAGTNPSNILKEPGADYSVERKDKSNQDVIGKPSGKDEPKNEKNKELPKWEGDFKIPASFRNIDAMDAQMADTVMTTEFGMPLLNLTNENVRKLSPHSTEEERKRAAKVVYSKLEQNPTLNALLPTGWLGNRKLGAVINWFNPSTNPSHPANRRWLKVAGDQVDRIMADGDDKVSVIPLHPEALTEAVANEISPLMEGLGNWIANKFLGGKKGAAETSLEGKPTTVRSEFLRAFYRALPVNNAENRRRYLKFLDGTSDGQRDAADFITYCNKNKKPPFILFVPDRAEKITLSDKKLDEAKADCYLVTSRKNGRVLGMIAPAAQKEALFTE